MPLACEIVVDAGVPFACVYPVTRALTYAWDALSAAPRGDWELAIRVVGDQEISRLHLEYFDDGSPTDVITFPGGDDFTEESGYLGDIAISFDTAKSQADDSNHSVEREIAFLALHGLLHILGQEDTTAEQRAAMIDQQNALLEAVESACPNLRCNE